MQKAMTLTEMKDFIHRKLQSSCYSDVREQTGVSGYAIHKWKAEPPVRPSLHVFCKLARYFGLNPTLKQLEPLL